jgi:4-hydroxy-3-polyprenylbenzoate decarboxylase
MIYLRAMYSKIQRDQYVRECSIFWRARRIFAAFSGFAARVDASAISRWGGNIQKLRGSAMTDKNIKPQHQRSNGWSRRDFIASTGTLVASGTATASSAASGSIPAAMALATSAQKLAPFDSLRDYVAAMEAAGNVMRFDRVDQDAYEGTALMYRLVDLYGLYRAPVVIFENVKIDGEWIKGPVIANQLRHVEAETLIFGLDSVPQDDSATWHRARQHLDELLADNNGKYPEIAPNVLPRDKALCKQVKLTGDQIDIRKFPFFRNNPGDSGRFLNTTSVFTRDPETGLNIGTYRCEIKGPRRIAVGSGEGQSGYNMLMAAKERGENNVPVTLVVGHDPMVWLVSGSRIPGRFGKKPIDELATAGGLRGKAVEAVKCDSNDFLVPAHSEMVIEGTVDFDSSEPNGPYGEGTGYMGAIYEKAFVMTVNTVTHRKDPWITNDFTGVSRPLIEQPGAALTVSQFKRFFPQISDYRYMDSVTWFRVRKTEPGQALEIGKKIANMIPVFKIIIMVDEDIDLWSDADRFRAFATRWQPAPASHIFSDLMPTMPLETSAPQTGMTSKIIIDATRQWPEEGGPKDFPRFSRDILENEAPDIFAALNEKWGDVLPQLFLSN